jgi:cysteinyl-tRNA synthetase
MGVEGQNRSSFTLFNTLTRRKEVFKPRYGNGVRMFTCGPSIYQRPHLGNYRTFLYEDILQRYLEYLGYTVRRVLNFTDVEDKAITEAQRQGVSLEHLTGKIAERFFEEAETLKIKSPTFNPRSSTTVDQAVRLIRVLLEKGYAYWHQGDVFYDPLKFKDFGKLYGLDMRRWPKTRKRFRKDTYTGMRWNYGDFILWHGYRAGDAVYWETEIGKGRPAWNVQDAGMATAVLGYELDVCCGGIDNLYRHHDYTIAIVEAVSGQVFANYWLHGGHLLVNGAKMSKSKGNVVYLDDLLRQGYSPDHIRLFLLSAHYREHLNLTDAALQTAKDTLDRVKAAITHLASPEKPVTPHDGEAEELASQIIPSFEMHLNDDLDVVGAVDAVSEVVMRLSQLKAEGRAGPEVCENAHYALKKVDDVLRVVF